MQKITKIWEDFNHEIKAYVTRRIGEQALVDDIVQDVFLKLMNNISTLDELHDIQPYLYKIARNTIADHFRLLKKTKDKNDLHQSFDLNTEDSGLNEIISKHCIIPFIKNLDPKYKEALMLTEIHNMPQKELAEHLKISYSGAKSRVQRGREKLKDMLMECCNFESDPYGNLLNRQNKDCC